MQTIFWANEAEDDLCLTIGETEYNTPCNEMTAPFSMQDDDTYNIKDLCMDIEDEAETEIEATFKRPDTSIYFLVSSVLVGGRPHRPYPPPTRP